ncbi:hypothetical protein MNV49_006093 [Pseudohyphozyma bogoriensis]|nr:hypothetical protein MNV49_006093 [Pseudohyphozyma bogoriensis]
MPAMLASPSSPYSPSAPAGVTSPKPRSSTFFSSLLKKARSPRVSQSPRFASTSTFDSSFDSASSSPSPSLAPSPLGSIPSSPALGAPVDLRQTPTPTRRVRLNSATPAWELPRSWEEWNEAYASGLFEFDDPPPPPTTAAESPEHFGTSPFAIHRAPTPPTERSRQRSVSELNFLGPGASAGELVKGNCYPAPTSPSIGDPKNHPVHKDLQKLCVEAKEKFQASGVSVSIADEGTQQFLAEVGFGVKVFKRETSLCSHTVLQAATTGSPEPMVILNMEEDWRFNAMFQMYSKGFYAGSPIMLPSALGDSTSSPTSQVPGGVFCIIRDAPQTEFTQGERDELKRLAARAGEVILGWQDEQRRLKRGEMRRRESEWRGLPEVREAMGDGWSDEGLKDEFSGLGISSSTEEEEGHVVEEGESRRPSASSVTSVGEYLTSAVSPTWCKRTRGREGVTPDLAAGERLPPQIRTIFEMATQLVAETLDLDFVYLMAFPLPSAESPDPVGRPNSKPLLLASHNLPFPPPFVSPELHLDALLSPTSDALFYVNPSTTISPNEFDSGLIVRVEVCELSGLGVVLGGFTQSQRRVLGREDLGFFRKFAADSLRKQMMPLCKALKER